MLGLRRALIALFCVGVLFAGFDLALVLASDHQDQKAVAAVLGPLIGLAFIGTGAFAWWRRPLNRFGVLMTSVGFAWFLGGLTSANGSVVFTIGNYGLLAMAFNTFGLELDPGLTADDFDAENFDI